MRIRIFFLLSTLILLGCKKFNSNEFAGRYKLDHPVLKTKIAYDFEPVLVINEDKTFTLKKDIQINGRWKFIEFEKDGTKIEFQFLGKHINGLYRGTIIYFEHPNDFDDGAFASMLYVKLSK